MGSLTTSSPTSTGGVFIHLSPQKTMSKRTKKQIKEDAKALKEMNEWSRKVFGYTKNGWLYIDNKPVSYIGEEEEEF
tara:strand:- start:52 stop:282 length:231 start_codon:yes stop_codon:yes gene_type:complete